MLCRFRHALLLLTLLAIAQLYVPAVSRARTKQQALISTTSKSGEEVVPQPAAVVDVDEAVHASEVPIAGAPSPSLACTSAGCLPSVFVIGAVKASTTFVSSALQRGGVACAGVRKEAHFFDAPRWAACRHNGSSRPTAVSAVGLGFDNDSCSLRAYRQLFPRASAARRNCSAFLDGTPTM